MKNSYSKLLQYSSTTLSSEKRRSIIREENFFLCPEELTPNEHSSLIDLALGSKALEVELSLKERALKINSSGDVKSWGKTMHEGSQTWIGLDPQTLNTPYSTIYEMLRIIQPKSNTLFLDLGAAYGRMGIILSALFPDCEFIGYELVHERVIEANRWYHELHCTHQKMLEQNLSDHKLEIPRADVYFIYDFGFPEQIRKLMSQIAKYEHPMIVVARGTTTRSIIDHIHPWLSQVHKPLHETTYSIYSNYRDFKKHT